MGQRQTHVVFTQAMLEHAKSLGLKPSDDKKYYYHGTEIVLAQDGYVMDDDFYEHGHKFIKADE